MPVKVLLQEVRKSKNLSQNDLARLTNMSLQNIQKIEQGGAKSLTFKTLTKFCQVLECQPGDLLVYEEEPAVENLKSVTPKETKSKKSKKRNKTTQKLDCSLLEVNNCISSIMVRPI